MENLIIIGGGPAGLAAATYAARANLKPLVIEGSVPGGQLTLTSDVENYPGFSKGILGPELVQEMKLQAERFGTRFISDSVQKIESDKRAKNVIVSSGTMYSARVILVATGADARWLGLPSEQKLRGKGVSACATCDGFFFRNKVVAVLGGGDSAMEDALVLTRFATKVYVIHRRDSFRASKIMQERVLKHPKIEVILNAEVLEIVGEEKVTGIKLKIPKSENRNPKQALKSEDLKQLRNSSFELRDLPLDGVFVAIGHTPATKFLEGSGVLLDPKQYIYTGARVAFELPEGVSREKFDKKFQYATSVDGIFAAGDCVDHVYRQAATAAGMGVAAELEIEKYLDEVESRKV
ncbi:MAG: thioredoxin-disulfide reductase [Patescibacteria group bacterium]|jgi:thioredoxin reductase (NADPH)